MTITSSSFGGGGANSVSKWVSGTTYALDDLVWSPISYLTYIRKVAGAGATDPSADGTNWAIFGAGRIRRILRGSITINAGATSATAAISPACDTAKTQLVNLGSVRNGAQTTDIPARIELTNSTTITASRSGAATTDAMFIAYELTEWW